MLQGGKIRRDLPGLSPAPKVSSPRQSPGHDRAGPARPWFHLEVKSEDGIFQSICSKNVLTLHQHGRLSATCHVCSGLLPSRPALVSREQSQGERQQPKGHMSDTRPLLHSAPKSLASITSLSHVPSGEGDQPWDKEQVIAWRDSGRTKHPDQVFPGPVPRASFPGAVQDEMLTAQPLATSSE